MPPRISRPLAAPTLYANHAGRQFRTSPCEAACPAGVPIQTLTALVREDRLSQALQFLRARNPFSSLTGRVCAHPCESACNRGLLDQALSIRALERHASEFTDEAEGATARCAAPTGKRVAIVGSGPAGMTCAYYCALLGHRVTVFEAAPYLGGMARAGIPDFRLPKPVLDRDLDRILALGVEARTGTAIGRDRSLDDLLNEHDACVVAAGAWKERALDMPGAKHALSSLAFLKRANFGARTSVGKKVVVIGGGGVAFDCAFTARRLGATEVHVVCLEGAAEMRATAEDIRQGDEEGITVHHGSTVTRIDGRESPSVEIAGITGFSFEAGGKVSVRLDAAPRRRIDADLVIAAIGLEVDIAALDPRNRIARTGRGTIAVDPATQATSLDRVYAAGDVVTGPATVAQAVGSGRLAAVAVHGALLGLAPDQALRIAIGGDGEPGLKTFAERTAAHVVGLAEMPNRDLFPQGERQSSERLPAWSAIASFDERDKGMPDPDLARTEAARCLHCGQCQSCGSCVEDCPGYVLEMTETGPRVAYPDECWHCGNCRISCPTGAVEYEFPVSMML